GALQPPPPLWPEDRTPARLIADNGGAPTSYPSSPFHSSSVSLNGAPGSDPFAAPPLVGGSTSFNGFPTSSIPPSPPPVHGAPPLAATTPSPVGVWTTAA